MLVSLQTTVAFAGYLAVFSLAGIASLAAAVRASRIDDAEIRTGLVWLLLTTGAWGLLQAGLFVVSGPLRKIAYTAGLVIGFATVGAWLYFASAYTNRGYHRNARVRRVAVVVFLAVSAAKVTNGLGLHTLYFTTEQSTTPFAHLAIEFGPLHWLVTGLSYSLAATALFALLDMYVRAGYDTRPVWVLTVVLGLPATLDVLGAVLPGVVNASYAPIGVTAFGVLALYVYEQRFVTAPETDGDAAVFLDADNRVRDYTAVAGRLFPGLAGARGQPLAAVLPQVAGAADDETVVGRRVDDEDRYYMVSDTPVELGASERRVLILSDVTATERRRRELTRHNEQLEELAGALAHELRNLIQIIDWRLAMADDHTGEGNAVSDSITVARDANKRMADRVDDFTTLAQYGQTVDRLEVVALRVAAENAWSRVDTGATELWIDGDATIDANPGRVQELLVNAFVFAVRNGAQTVTVEPHNSGFAVVGDGEPPGDAAGYLAFGESVPDAESGMKLPNARVFARVHGWSATIDTEYQAGVRFVVSDVRVHAVDESARPSA